MHRRSAGPFPEGQDGPAAHLHLVQRLCAARLASVLPILRILLDQNGFKLPDLSTVCKKKKEKKLAFGQFAWPAPPERRAERPGWQNVDTSKHQKVEALRAVGRLRAADAPVWQTACCGALRIVAPFYNPAYETNQPGFENTGPIAMRSDGTGVAKLLRCGCGGAGDASSSRPGVGPEARASARRGARMAALGDRRGNHRRHVCRGVLEPQTLAPGLGGDSMC